MLPARGAQVQSLTPPPLWGAKMFERSRPLYKPKWRNWLAPQAPENFGALFNRSPHVFTLKMLSFFWAFSLGPQEGRICVATSDFVAISIFPRHGDQCRLLLIEDPTLKAQPQHEVAINVPAPPYPVKGAKMFKGCRGRGLHLGAPPCLPESLYGRLTVVAVATAAVASAVVRWLVKAVGWEEAKMEKGRLNSEADWSFPQAKLGKAQHRVP